jgi:hypothetical protein
MVARQKLALVGLNGTCLSSDLTTALVYFVQLERHDPIPEHEGAAFVVVIVDAPHGDCETF